MNSNEGDFQVVNPFPGRGSNLVAIQEIDEDKSPSRFTPDGVNHGFVNNKLGGDFSAPNSTVVTRMGHNNANTYDLPGAESS